jgi:beta-glucanase (GH16 family)
MGVYDTKAEPLSAVYDASGNELDYAYDVESNLVYSKAPSQDDSDDAYISGRTLLFEDKFETINTNNWGFELGRVRNNELQYYTNNGNNVEITENKELCITAKRESYVNADWTSASLTSFGKKEFRYGRLEAKIKFPKIAGAFPAFWTLGTQLVLRYYADGTWMTHASGNWPYCGENDIVEHYAGGTDQVTCGAYYSETDQQGVGKVSVGRVNRNIDMSQYHVYAVEWTETSMTYYLDGVQWSQFAITDAMAQSFRASHYIILNLAVGASGGTPASSTNEMKMYVDWVRVYAPLES